MAYSKDKKKQRKRKELQRVATGVPRLDFILKGGFVKGSTYTLFGPPGSGKTLLANQVCFYHIKYHQGRCVYLTLLAETHGKMMKHLETLNFFDSECVSQGKLSYISAYQTLKKEKLQGVLHLIRKTLTEHQATFFVLDGLQVAGKISNAKEEFDEFIHELQAYFSMLNCTALLMSPSSEALSDEAENVITDGIIELSYRLVGPRAVRELTIHKFRGTEYLLGRHEVEITQDGLQIHPRTEIQFNEPPANADENRIRMGFGIRRLDEMLSGGLLSGSATTLLGSPGTGKTMLGLSFLVEGAKRGQKGVYFGFYEPPPRLIEKAERVGIELRKYTDRKMIELIWQPPLEHYMDALAEQLLEKASAEKKGHEKRRLFIDGIEGFRSAAVYMDRMPRFISAFTNQLRTADITTLISEELDLFKPEVEMPNPELATVTEGVILVRYVELKSQIHRLISILKMRESRYDTSIREFNILDRGIVVSQSFESAENVLSGHGRLLHGQGQSQSQAPFQSTPENSGKVVKIPRVSERKGAVKRGFKK